jgi:hypothetical protein
MRAGHLSCQFGHGGQPASLISGVRCHAEAITTNGLDCNLGHRNHRRFVGGIDVASLPRKVIFPPCTKCIDDTGSRQRDELLEV